MNYIMSHQFLGGKYSKWIVIFEEFDLDFIKSKSKKSLDFVELICDFLSLNSKSTTDDIIPNETLFMIDSYNSRYGDIIIYL